MLQLFKNDVVTSAAQNQADVRQHELDFYMNNYLTWGGTSTVMAGFVFSQLTSPVPDGTNIYLQTAYLVSISLCLGLNLCVITWTVLCCMWGPGLALRGPDGMKSFHRAIDFLKSEQNQIYNTFMFGVLCYFFSVCTLVWVYPSDSSVNTVMMGCFAVFLFAVMFMTWRVEVRIGGSIFEHAGPDGKIAGFEFAEGVADLDNYISAQMNDALGMSTAEQMPGMY